jgi:ADP-ribosyl-[dinitrogen reductase] hydrolase
MMRSGSEADATQDHSRTGAILGLAVGDALGATYEFCSPEDVSDGPLEIVGGGWLDLTPGETTDDTALAKAVLKGYQEGPLDLHRVRDAILRWQESDPKDIGNQTSKTLDYLRDHPEALSFPNDPDAQGNGAVMRAAAHGIMAESREQAVDNAWVEAALTHPSWEARACSALVAGLVGYIIEGELTGNALEISYSLVETRDEVGKEVRELLRPLERYDHNPGGWTVYTTRLALLALLEATDFRSGVEDVVRLAGDADTNGAVAGTLLGARFGAREIPSAWLSILREKRELLELV